MWAPPRTTCLSASLLRLPGPDRQRTGRGWLHYQGIAARCCSAGLDRRRPLRRDHHRPRSLVLLAASPRVTAVTRPPGSAPPAPAYTPGPRRRPPATRGRPWQTTSSSLGTGQFQATTSKRSPEDLAEEPLEDELDEEASSIPTSTRTQPSRRTTWSRQLRKQEEEEPPASRRRRGGGGRRGPRRPRRRRGRSDTILKDRTRRRRGHPRRGRRRRPSPRNGARPVTASSPSGPTNSSARPASCSCAALRPRASSATRTARCSADVDRPRPLRVLAGPVRPRDRSGSCFRGAAARCPGPVETGRGAAHRVPSRVLARRRPSGGPRRP